MVYPLESNSDIFIESNVEQIDVMLTDNLRKTTDIDNCRDLNSENQCQNERSLMYLENEENFDIGEVRNVYSRKRKESEKDFRQPSSSKVTFSLYTFYI